MQQLYMAYTVRRLKDLAGLYRTNVTSQSFLPARKERKDRIFVFRDGDVLFLSII